MVAAAQILNAQSKSMEQFLSPGLGSFGQEQLDWIADQLDEGKPTFLMFHHPPGSCAPNEAPDARYPDIASLLEAYADVLESVYVGHSHRWVLADEEPETVIMGSVRYDADNWWVHEFDPRDMSWRRLDEDKAVWGTQAGYPADYDANGATLRASGPEGDDAGDFEGWDPQPPGGWPPGSDQ